MLKLKELREQKGLTQTELAQKAGIHYKTVWRIERGKVRPHKLILKAIAKALGVKKVEELEVG